MSEMEIRSKKGASCRRLLQTAFRSRMSIFKSGISGSDGITSHVATLFCNHLAKLLHKIVASQKTNTSHVATIFCNHLAKLLQTDPEIPDLKMFIRVRNAVTNRAIGIRGLGTKR
jgi:hypothetical protein